MALCTPVPLEWRGHVVFAQYLTTRERPSRDLRDVLKTMVWPDEGGGRPRAVQALFDVHDVSTFARALQDAVAAADDDAVQSILRYRSWVLCVRQERQARGLPIEPGQRFFDDDAYDPGVWLMALLAALAVGREDWITFFGRLYAPSMPHKPGDPRLRSLLTSLIVHGHMHEDLVESLPDNVQLPSALRILPGYAALRDALVHRQWRRRRSTLTN